jgi:hypothetical protein
VEEAVLRRLVALCRVEKLAQTLFQTADVADARGSTKWLKKLAAVWRSRCRRCGGEGFFNVS